MLAVLGVPWGMLLAGAGTFFAIVLLYIVVGALLDLVELAA
jgi:hypothetical protein